ncbi:uncharacterized protein LOC110681128 [Aedes aegypti]|uniref:Uncharacterized protein n=1 Tax=Aedes aegypti TaxID=7159 RepID=A0A6I8U3C2_AEDAE|nr:uncharacterized protein LOC110675233 [Aedes aegypti]XP_021712590.1 uncharacterized protein LOC110681128 [Aedes aegypti]
MEQLAHFVTKSFEYNNSRVLDILDMRTIGSGGGNSRAGLGEDFHSRSSDPELMSNNSSSVASVGENGDLEEEIHSHTLAQRQNSVGSGGGENDDEESIDIEITDLSYSSAGGANAMMNGVGESDRVKPISSVSSSVVVKNAFGSGNGSDNNNDSVISNRNETSVIRKHDNKLLMIGRDNSKDEEMELTRTSITNKKHVPKNWLIADLVEEKQDKHPKAKQDVALNLVRSETEPSYKSSDMSLLVRPKPASELLKQSVDLINGGGHSYPPQPLTPIPPPAQGGSEHDGNGYHHPSHRTHTGNHTDNDSDTAPTTRQIANRSSGSAD